MNDPERNISQDMTPTARACCCFVAGGWVVGLGRRRPPRTGGVWCRVARLGVALASCGPLRAAPQRRGAV